MLRQQSYYTYEGAFVPAVKTGILPGAQETDTQAHSLKGRLLLVPCSAGTGTTARTAMATRQVGGWCVCGVWGGRGVQGICRLLLHLGRGAVGSLCWLALTPRSQAPLAAVPACLPATDRQCGNTFGGLGCPALLMCCRTGHRPEGPAATPAPGSAIARAPAVCRACNDVEKNPALALYSKKLANFRRVQGVCQQVRACPVLESMRRRSSSQCRSAAQTSTADEWLPCVCQRGPLGLPNVRVILCCCT